MIVGNGGCYFRFNASLAVGKPFCKKVLPTPLPKIFDIALLRSFFYEVW